MNYQEDMYFVNSNHSHPEYPEKAMFGKFCLSDNGIVFTFADSRWNPLVIAWRNLVSTYPSYMTSPNLLIKASWIAGQIPALLTVMTGGMIRPFAGKVSIKYKEVSIDKVVVSEFVCYAPVFVISRPAKHWANNLDAQIWAAKKVERGLEI